MRTYGSVLSLLLIWMPLNQAFGDANLEALRQTFDDSSGNIALEQAMTLRNLRAKYLEALETYLDRSRAQGNLEEVVALKREIATLKGEPASPATAAEPAVLARLRSSYSSQISNANLESARKLVTLSQQYGSALERLRTALTQDDKVQDALTVKKELERLAGNRQVAEARKTVARGAEAATAEKSEPAEEEEIETGPTFSGRYAFRARDRQASALSKYDGDEETEAAVMRALRWLKKHQDADGSWPQFDRPANTGFALLALLAHGETLASEEFGETIRRGLNWLIANQEENGHFRHRDGHDYSHAIATIALCEACALVEMDDLRSAAEKAVKVIVKGQHESGGWDYNYLQNSRDDTSFMGWCAQALKAAEMAGIGGDEVTEAMDRAIDGFRKNSDPNGGFGYVKPGRGNLTGTGVFCMQLLGAGNKTEARKGLLWLKNFPDNWREPTGERPVYYWYYVNQAMFHRGGLTWKRWGREFLPTVVAAQQVLEGQGVNGEAIGYWEPISNKERHGDVYTTSLCALMLQVYYRLAPMCYPAPKG